MDAESKTITVEIWSDIACPWCYVGETNFKIARESFKKTNPHITIKTNYHAYMIDRGTKKNGEEYLAYNQRRWGSDGWTYSLREAGKKIGCAFSNWKTWPNTFLAHCLIAEASKQNKGEEVLDEIFNYCYEQGENVSLKETLDKIAKKFELNSNWDCNENQTCVNNDDKVGKEEYGIGGVPFFMIGKYALEGAQPPKAFLAALNRLIK